MTPSVRELLGTTVVVITSDGKILTRSQAIFFVLEQTGWGWFAKALASPPLVWIMNIGYGLVARNRAWLSAKFFGRTACGLDNRYPEIDSLSYLQQNEPTVKKT
jgi:predicted DCC family thiol-disulfide oxidoreductase YuxK